MMRGMMTWVLVLAGIVVAAPSWAVTIDWVTVGAPGNACDPQSDGCFGAVAYEYQISKYEVTNAQYTEFLNAVAATDTYDLFHTNMASAHSEGGITRSGSPGSYTYNAIAERENMPVNWVSWHDSLRFSNWLQNGQPAGAQDETTTEYGAYIFSSATSVGPRRPVATIFLPSEDEWYKAAYFDTSSSVYYDYPAGTDTEITCALPGTTANTANCYIYGHVLDVTDVGSYTGSASPNGTFDQGGNVYEWDEALVTSSYRGVRGGSYRGFAGYTKASYRASTHPENHSEITGFRVASRVVVIPEPSTALLLGVGLMGLAVKRRTN